MKLGITTIIKNRGRWIKEWVAFHHLIGFDIFYIYIHDSNDESLDICKKLQSHFDIRHFVLDEKTSQPQYFAYNHSYQNFCHEVDWMAFIDGDEFLFPTNSDSLKDLLEKFFYMRTSALAVYWATFGSSGHLHEPDGLIIENFRYRGKNEMPANRHVKSIVKGRQGELVKCIKDPHVFNTPYGTVDEKLRPITGGLTNHIPTYEFVRINHYATQSREFYLNFKKRGGFATDTIDVI
jgi:hypothetical protein